MVSLYIAMGGVVIVDLIEDNNCSHINYDMICTVQLSNSSRHDLRHSI